ncbi:DUF6199 family natural product biosynthesis protein [Ammoniphilus sp. CFH 90114]|uniref:DUF6199 family natural product biosynthesis protein n=1 Tax=Ammoniphilus sp. CFH 90114 TaxID=2493665 RepID=UPI00100E3033|nr:DUF6199 family natural product biosynthesis protein [Ammoniphilus sp. CFH 90114]RXT03835.1 hypothetical protein EIZ39_22935 [Ammoniphilus sp. CFH 90114]
MSFFGFILLLVGLLMFIKPQVFWLLTESWKSNQADEPSSFYLWSTRFGGVVFTIVGISTILASFLQE